MPEMSIPQRQTFLESGTRTAHVALMRDDGRPHVTPVWFVLDGDDVVFVTKVHSLKGRTLADGDAVAVSVDEPHPPYAFVMIEGTVTLSRDPDELQRWAGPIARRYATDVPATAQRISRPGELLVRVTPTSTVAVTYD